VLQIIVTGGSLEDCRNALNLAASDGNLLQLKIVSGLDHCIPFVVHNTELFVVHYAAMS